LNKRGHFKEYPMNERFVLNRRDAKVMGVASGLADYTSINAFAIRLGMVVATLLTGPAMVLLYFLTGWLVADR
jgi:phage shock protein C